MTTYPFGLILRGGAATAEADSDPLSAAGALAAIFLIVVIAEGTSYANLPVSPCRWATESSIRALPRASTNGLALVAPVHLGGPALIDRGTGTARLFLPGLLVGLAGSWIWPHLHPQAAAVPPLGPAAEFDGSGLGAGCSAGGCRRVVAGSPGRLAKAWSAAWLGLSRLAAGGGSCWRQLSAGRSSAFGAHAGGRTVGLMPDVRSAVWISGWAAFARMLFHP